MAKEMKYLCDAQVMKDQGFNYLKFIIDNDEYSHSLQNYPGGEFVEIYIKVK